MVKTGKEGKELEKKMEGRENVAVMWRGRGNCRERERGREIIWFN